jgi:hypothetical protein
MCREVLKECPLAVEAIRCLLQLGVKLKEIQVGHRYHIWDRKYQREFLDMGYIIEPLLIFLNLWRLKFIKMMMMYDGILFF